MIVLSEFVSKKFKFWAFISMVLLVFVHGYNLEPRFLQPWTMPDGPVNLSNSIQYFFANAIFRFRIPMLFIISGYLYALHDEKPYKVRIRKRLRTLLAPYLLWSSIAIILVFFIELFPFGRSLQATTHLSQIDQTRILLHDYRWYEVLARWIFFPLPFQLWFIRVLLIYNLAYPWLKKCAINKIASRIFFPLATLFWLSSGGLGLIEGEGLLFFTLGIWMQKKDFNIETPKRWLNPRWWFASFIILAAAKTYLAYNGIALMGNAAYPVMAMIHKLIILYKVY